MASKSSICFEGKRQRGMAYALILLLLLLPKLTELFISLVCKSAFLKYCVFKFDRILAFCFLILLTIYCRSLQILI